MRSAALEAISSVEVQLFHFFFKISFIVKVFVRFITLR